MNRYWDSNLFLHILMDDDPLKVAQCRSVLEEARAGKVMIVTSALTIAEVLWIRGKPRIPADNAERVQQFFEHEWIYVRELSRDVAEEARRIVWDHGVPPKDAIHVATALTIHRDAPLAQLDTFDQDDLWPLNEKLGSLPLRIGPPEIPGRLPV